MAAVCVRVCACYLRHVEAGLTDGELKDGAGPLHVAQDGLQLGELDPGGAVLRAELQVLLVQLPAAVELAQLQLQLDVALEQLVLGTLPDGRTLRAEGHRLIGSHTGSIYFGNIY